MINIEILTARDEYTPTKAHRDDAAYDVRAAIPEDIVLLEGIRAIIPLGFKLGLPVGYKACITPRSGLAAKLGITILNSPGIIDEGYRGEVCVILLNTGTEPFTIRNGDRIAQMTIEVVLATTLVPTLKLGDTARGEGKFGSTGVA